MSVTVIVGAWWLVGSRAATESAAGPAPTVNRPVTLTVHNAEGPCRPLRTLECALRVARDPYAAYARNGNRATLVWHGDRLTGHCVVTDGTLVTDESGITSTRWYLVTTDLGVQGWLPGVRTRNTIDLRICSAGEVAHRSAP